MIFEKIIFEVVAASRSRSQKGDLSQSLMQQGFFGTPTGQIPKSLAERDKFLSGGNPVDVQGDFEKQNPDKVKIEASADEYTGTLSAAAKQIAGILQGKQTWEVTVKKEGIIVYPRVPLQSNYEEGYMLFSYDGKVSFVTDSGHKTLVGTETELKQIEVSKDKIKIDVKGIAKIIKKHIPTLKK